MPDFSIGFPDAASVAVIEEWRADDLNEFFELWQQRSGQKVLRLFRQAQTNPQWLSMLPSEEITALEGFVNSQIILALPKHSGIESLTIQNTDIDDELIKSIKHLHGLKCLRLDNCRLALRSRESLAGLDTVECLLLDNTLANPQDLASKTFRPSNVKSQPGESKKTENAAALRTKFLSVKVTRKELDGLFSTKSFDNLIGLSLSGNPTLSADQTAKLKRYKDLRFLSLSHVDGATSGAFKFLCELPCLEALEVVFTSRREVAIPELNSLKKLTKLELNCDNIASLPQVEDLTNIGFHCDAPYKGQLKEILRGSRLQHVNLLGSQFSQDDIFELNELKSLSSLALGCWSSRFEKLPPISMLWKLECLSVMYSDLELFDFCALPCFPLRKLRLANSTLAKSAFESIKECSELELLDLENVPLFNETSIGAISNLSNLKELSLPIVRASSFLRGLERLVKLKRLELTVNEFSGVDMTFLSSQRHLEFIDISSIRHTAAEFVKYLPPDIKAISISGLNLSDSDMVSLSNLHALEEVYISSSTVTQKLVDSLRSNPRLRVLELSGGSEALSLDCLGDVFPALEFARLQGKMAWDCRKMSE